jgi:hypothetical protein
VQLMEIENSLPNGFHDAFLESIHVDYESRRATFKLQLWIGDIDAATKTQREAYEESSLELLDLVYLVVEGPDPRTKYADAKKLWIDAGEAKPGTAPGTPIPVEQLPRGTFAYWIFVRDWNSFIHVAARGARLKRSSEGVSTRSRLPTKHAAGR